MGYPSSWGQKFLGSDIQNISVEKLLFDQIIENAKKVWAEERK